MYFLQKRTIELPGPTGRVIFFGGVIRQRAVKITQWIFVSYTVRKKMDIMFNH